MFRDATFAPEMVVLPAGEFMMGSAITENGTYEYEYEEPRHNVTVGRRFAIGRYPVTFAEYDRFCQAERRTGSLRIIAGGADSGRSSRSVGMMPRPTLCGCRKRPAGTTGCRRKRNGNMPVGPGTTTRYSFGDAITPDDANYADLGLSRTSEVGSYPANPWGLHDMHGNVWEWVEDDWHENYRGAPTNGSAWRDAASGRNPRLCVLRGGSWEHGSWGCRSAYRGKSGTHSGSRVVGFRVARTLS